MASILSKGQRKALEVLDASEGGLSSIEWQPALGSNPGTFFHSAIDCYSSNSSLGTVPSVEVSGGSPRMGEMCSSR